MGFTGELDRLSRALFSIFVDRVGMCRLGYQTEISRAGTVLIFTPQIAEGEVQAELARSYGVSQATISRLQA